MRDSAERTPEQEFAGYFREHYAQVFAYARRRCSDELAAEVVSETFLIAWRRRAQSADGGRPWFFKTARLALNNALRTERRQHRVNARVAALHGTSAAEGPDENSAETDTVIRTLRGLSAPDREVLMLAHWEDLGAADLGTALDCSAGTAAVRLHRARRRFRHALLADSTADTLPPSLKETVR